MAAPNASVLNAETPAEWAQTVTPSDSVSFSQRPRAIYVGGAGNVSCQMSDGDSVVFVGVPTGFILPVRAIRVNATGTTATGIVALY